MPDKKSSKDSDGDDAGGKKKSPILAIVVCVVMLGAGYFVGGMMSGGDGEAPVAEAAGDEVEAEVEEHHELGSLHQLDAININLQEGHFLRIAVALETEHSDGGGHGDEEDFPTAPAADLLLATFSGRTVEELSTAEGREAARLELLDAVAKKYDGEVYGLYFTEFVMQ